MMANSSPSGSLAKYTVLLFLFSREEIVVLCSFEQRPGSLHKPLLLQIAGAAGVVLTVQHAALLRPSSLVRALKALNL